MLAITHCTNAANIMFSMRRNSEEKDAEFYDKILKSAKEIVKQKENCKWSPNKIVETSNSTDE